MSSSVMPCLRALGAMSGTRSQVTLPPTGPQVTLRLTARPPGPVPAENRVGLLTCVSSFRQAAWVYSLIRPLRMGFRRIRRAARLGDALVWAARVVVRLVLGQDGAQVRLAEDQHPVQKLAAQGSYEALAGRVHPRCPDGGAQDRGAGGLEDGVEGAGEVRSAVADQEPELLEAPVHAHGEVAGLLGRPLAGGMRGDATQVHTASAVLDEHQDIQPFQQGGVDVQEGRRR